MEDRIKFEYIGDCTRRLKVPGGWLVQINSGAMCFVSDPNHKWLSDDTQ